MAASLFHEVLDKYFARVIGAISERYNGKGSEPAFLHKSMLNEEYSADLIWGSTQINHSIVAADVVSLDSSLPLKKRGVISNASGKLPKIGILYEKGEQFVQDVNAMMVRGVDEATIVSKIMDDVSKVIKGIETREEIMFLQALSTGYCLVGDGTDTDASNQGTGIRASFGYKSENFFKATKAKWETTATATPITDIQQLFDKASEDGNDIAKVLISQKYVDLMRQTTEGKQCVADYRGLVVTSKTDLVTPSRPAMVEALGSYFGVEFQVINANYKVEGLDGTVKNAESWHLPNIVAVPTEKVGRLVYGSLVEETYPVADVNYQKSGNYILVSKFSDKNPWREYTAGQALAIPVIDGGDSIYVLQADQTA